MYNPNMGMRPPMMPSMPRPAAEPENTPENPPENPSSDLFVELDKIVSFMGDCAMWAKRMANQCRKLHIRGYGRWLDCESVDTFKEIVYLEKIMWDKTWKVPTIDFSKFHDTQGSLAGIEDFKAMHKHWEDKKEKLIECLNKAMTEARTVDVQLYKKLMCLTDKMQDDKVRVSMAYNRLEFAGWNKHDIGVVSMIIHKYFEEHHKDGDAYNLNLG